MYKKLFLLVLCSCFSFFSVNAVSAINSDLNDVIELVIALGVQDGVNYGKSGETVGKEICEAGNGSSCHYVDNNELAPHIALANLLSEVVMKPSLRIIMVEWPDHEGWDGGRERGECIGVKDSMLHCLLDSFGRSPGLEVIDLTFCPGIEASIGGINLKPGFIPRNCSESPKKGQTFFYRIFGVWGSGSGPIG